MYRSPIASGSFYPGNQEELESVLKTLMEDCPQRQKALGAISPHAG
jgi:AmmeMemoRadiSam system protein B